ncbi:hypothetical protein HK102_000343, partial [Quaeritorhiza haematococci]
NKRGPVKKKEDEANPADANSKQINLSPNRSGGSSSASGPSPARRKARKVEEDDDASYAGEESDVENSEEELTRKKIGGKQMKSPEMAQQKTSEDNSDQARLPPKAQASRKTNSVNSKESLPSASARQPAPQTNGPTRPAIPGGPKSFPFLMVADKNSPLPSLAPEFKTVLLAIPNGIAKSMPDAVEKTEACFDSIKYMWDAVEEDYWVQFCRQAAECESTEAKGDAANPNAIEGRYLRSSTKRPPSEHMSTLDLARIVCADISARVLVKVRRLVVKFETQILQDILDNYLQEHNREIEKYAAKEWRLKVQIADLARKLEHGKGPATGLADSVGGLSAMDIDGEPSAALDDCESGANGRGKQKLRAAEMRELAELVFQALPSNSNSSGIGSSKTNLDSHEYSFEELKAGISQLHQQLQNQRREITSLRTRTVSSPATLMSPFKSTADNAAEQSLCVQLRDRADTLRRELSESKSQCSKISEQVKNLENRLAESDQAHELEVKKYKAEITRLTRQKEGAKEATLLKQVDSLKRELAEEKAAQKRAIALTSADERRKAKGADKNLGEYGREIEASTAAAVNIETTQLREQVQSLQGELEAACLVADKMSGRVTELEKGLKTAKQEYEKRIADHEAEIERLRTERVPKDDGGVSHVDGEVAQIPEEEEIPHNHPRTAKANLAAEERHQAPRRENHNQVHRGGKATGLVLWSDQNQYTSPNGHDAHPAEEYGSELSDDLLLNSAANCTGIVDEEGPDRDPKSHLDDCFAKMTMVQQELCLSEARAWKLTRTIQTLRHQMEDANAQIEGGSRYRPITVQQQSRWRQDRIAHRQLNPQRANVGRQRERGRDQQQRQQQREHDLVMTDSSPFSSDPRLASLPWKYDDEDELGLNDNGKRRRGEEPWGFVGLKRRREESANELVDNPRSSSTVPIHSDDHRPTPSHLQGIDLSSTTGFSALQSSPAWQGSISSSASKEGMITESELNAQGKNITFDQAQAQSVESGLAPSRKRIYPQHHADDEASFMRRREFSETYDPFGSSPVVQTTSGDVRAGRLDRGVFMSPPPSKANSSSVPGSVYLGTRTRSDGTRNDSNGTFAAASASFTSPQQVDGDNTNKDHIHQFESGESTSAEKSTAHLSRPHVTFSLQTQSLTRSAKSLPTTATFQSSGLQGRDQHPAGPRSKSTSQVPDGLVSMYEGFTKAFKKYSPENQGGQVRGNSVSVKGNVSGGGYGRDFGGVNTQQGGGGPSSSNVQAKRDLLREHGFTIPDSVSNAEELDDTDKEEFGEEGTRVAPADDDIEHYQRQYSALKLTPAGTQAGLTNGKGNDRKRDQEDSEEIYRLQQQFSAKKRSGGVVRGEHSLRFQDAMSPLLSRSTSKTFDGEDAAKSMTSDQGRECGRYRNGEGDLDGKPSPGAYLSSLSAADMKQLLALLSQGGSSNSCGAGLQ